MLTYDLSLMTNDHCFKYLLSQVVTMCSWVNQEKDLPPNVKRTSECVILHRQYQISRHKHIYNKRSPIFKAKHLWRSLYLNLPYLSTRVSITSMTFFLHYLWLVRCGVENNLYSSPLDKVMYCPEATMYIQLEYRSHSSPS